MSITKVALVYVIVSSLPSAVIDDCDDDDDHDAPDASSIVPPSLLSSCVLPQSIASMRTSNGSLPENIVQFLNQLSNGSLTSNSSNDNNLTTTHAQSSHYNSYNTRNNKVARRVHKRSATFPTSGSSSSSNGGNYYQSHDPSSPSSSTRDSSQGLSSVFEGGGEQLRYSNMSVHRPPVIRGTAQQSSSASSSISIDPNLVSHAVVSIAHLVSGLISALFQLDETL
jgi:hypothetical protein